MAESIHYQFAVYLLPAHGTDPAVVLQKVLSKKSATLKLVDAITKDPQEMVVHAHMQKNVQHEYAPPSMDSLQYFGYGITREQAQALQKSEEAFILEFAHPKQHVWKALRTANALVEDVARESGGLVWDEETREVFSPDAWHQKRLGSWTDGVPNIASQTVVHVYKKDEFVRAITLGMKKAGLPDVVVDEFPWSSEKQVGNLINLFCQALAEGAAIERPGRFDLNLRTIKLDEVREPQLKSLKTNATTVGYLSLKQGIWEDGDPHNGLIQLSFDRYAGNDMQAKQNRMLVCLFGWEDNVTAVRHNDELLEASRQARTKLPELRRAFSAGLQPGEFIQVKVPFQAPNGGNEWMWVEVTSWGNSKIKGLLENEPSYIPDLHGGQIVDVRENDIFDYIREYPDGRREGNTTGEILKKMEHLQKPDSRDPVGGQLASRPETAACTPDSKP